LEHNEPYRTLVPRPIADARGPSRAPKLSALTRELLEGPSRPVRDALRRHLRSSLRLRVLAELRASGSAAVLDRVLERGTRRAGPGSDRKRPSALTRERLKALALPLLVARGQLRCSR